MAQKDGQIKEFQTQIRQLELGIEQEQSEVRKKPDFKLNWKKGAKAPENLVRGSSTIVGNIAYFNEMHDGASYVYAFDWTTEKWSTLPQCPYLHPALANVQENLVAIGGEFTNKLFSYSNKKWVEQYPPMPTDRVMATALSTKTHLIVLGGYGEDMSAVEIMELATSKWSTASPLPYGTYRAAVTLCGDVLYLMGGNTEDEYPTLHVLSCNIHDLLQSSQPSASRQPSSSVAAHSKVWHNIPDLPVECSTCVTINKQLVAIGGMDKQGKISNAMYKFDRDTNKWSVISNIDIARSYCLAAVLPNQNLLVVGGYTAINKGPPFEITTDETEIATIIA